MEAWGQTWEGEWEWRNRQKTKEWMTDLRARAQKQQVDFYTLQEHLLPASLLTQALTQEILSWKEEPLR